MCGANPSAVILEISQATALARQMVTRWGMRPEVGLLTIEPSQTPATPFGMARDYEATADRIDRETARLISAGTIANTALG
jgi:ATP-dependent Zn protease